MSDDTAAAPAPADDESLGLPNWLEDMMKPGVGAGVFFTLKLSLGERCAQPAAHQPFLERCSHVRVCSCLQWACSSRSASCSPSLRMRCEHEA